MHACFDINETRVFSIQIQDHVHRCWRLFTHSKRHKKHRYFSSLKKIWKSNLPHEKHISTERRPPLWWHGWSWKIWCSLSKGPPFLFRNFPKKFSIYFGKPPFFSLERFFFSFLTLFTSLIFIHACISILGATAFQFQPFWDKYNINLREKPPPSKNYLNPKASRVNEFDSKGMTQGLVMVRVGIWRVSAVTIP